VIAFRPIARGLLCALLVTLWGCGTVHQTVREDEAVQRPTAEIAEEQLLDVWIALFDPGALPDDKDDTNGLSMEIRRAEARYMPVQLRGTLEKTGYWGAVRVVPQKTVGADLLVQGRIVASDGEQLTLDIDALDASGRRWLQKSYTAKVTLADYKASESSHREVFQPLYNAVANDLAAFRATLSAADLQRIRQVAELRFGADLAPDVFSAYLHKTDEAQWRIVRLPAREEPMVARIRAIRERDFLLVDTLNGHFDNLYADMQQPYFDWRKSRLEELQSLREIQSQARNRKLLGAAAILGAIAIEVLGGDSTRASTGTLRNVMIVGGAYAVKTGFDKDSEATIHADAIAELGESFSAETQPMVVEVEGQTHELTGSAEAQYQAWRHLLKRIYAAETGLSDHTP